MICADRDIILLNKRYDPVNRREVYFPTQISGVSLYDSRRSSSDGGFHVQSEKFRLRIPIGARVQNGRSYLPEAQYDALTDGEAVDHWTLHNEDILLVCPSGLTDVNVPVFRTVPVTVQQAEALADGNAEDSVPVRLAPYLYDIRLPDVDYEKGAAYFARYRPSFGGCSCAVNGSVIGRNYDWLYDETASFAVHTPSGSGRHAVDGIARGTSALTDAFVRSGAGSEDYGILPFLLLDGVNDHGLFCEINVVSADKGRTTGTNPGSEPLFAAMVPRYVLDHAASVEEAIALIRAKDIFCADAGGLSEEFHFLLTDGRDTAAVEFVDNEVTVVDTFVGGKPVMTNHHLSGYDGTRGSLTPYAMGIERQALLTAGLPGADTAERMLALMKTVRYSRTYDVSAGWYSEFAGNWPSGNLTKDTPPEAYLPVMERYAEIFAHRTRNGAVWHTVHTSVYDLGRKTLTVCPQEREETFTFAVGRGGNAGFRPKLIHITEYADNTRRGSASVRHWRIGGA